MANFEAVVVGKWSIGYTHEPHGMTVLLFEFPDRAPITLALAPETAAKLATAMLEQLAHPPPRPERRN